MKLYLAVNTETNEVSYEDLSWMHTEDPSNNPRYALVDGWEYRQFSVVPTDIMNQIEMKVDKLHEVAECLLDIEKESKKDKLKLINT